ncbi:hypothetical protein F441_18491 [Phytophthora nicotianae CJ01A1]|uniref:Uncharacterized protein n=6 Tax=Phytophthora nicotianae TaxID=4792 RepID=W2PMJ4_PHYN3|nr:hypothetical protein PPTG_24094 [Phytophthora nicotianae INRA-310]ETI34940.1 hypothetical protein F443_18631 [Phytophthora nicotianae P1569]ETK75226.1 hypothetical protein L915_18112 [Phytophthora nicotianae]ETO59135.1 hypothetical protein F444_22489 [Phytophthora nicotianae P1976]ETP04761.1 hypothetical protein F441_18491 [Phytophthora nicotianae CJ01A1]ETP32940.1 hypothetical protein F442_18432 [Phytophthora nicotianae P10297]
MVRRFEHRWKEHVTECKGAADLAKLAEDSAEIYLAQVDQVWIQEQLQTEMTQVLRGSGIPRRRRFE